jgi:hypothetical protein
MLIAGVIYFDAIQNLILIFGIFPNVSPSLLELLTIAAYFTLSVHIPGHSN